MFGENIDRWQLIPDGDPIVTHTSRLLLMRWQDRAALAQMAIDAEEECGDELMAWWDGQGVPLVLAREGRAVVLEHGTNLAEGFARTEARCGALDAR
jgi:streptomycin 6-kinase